MPNSTVPLRLRPFDKRSAADIEHKLSSNWSPWPHMRWHFWRRVVTFGDFTAAAAVTQEIDLHDDVTAAHLARSGQAGQFPANVDIMRGTYIRTITDWAGGAATSATVEVGDTGDPNGLVTSTSVFTGVGAGIVRTSAAAEYDTHDEAAFIPTLTITSDVNINTLTAGSLEIVIPFMFRLIPQS